MTDEETMADRIELTPEQEAQLPTHAESWVRRSLEVRPANRERAEKGIMEYYRLGNLSYPKAIVWADDPLITVISGPVAGLIVESDSEHDVRAVVEQTVDRVTKSVRKHLETGCNPMDDFTDAEKEAVRNHWHQYIGGQFWSSWPAAVGTFYRDVCGVNIAPGVVEAAECATECGWWWPHEDYVVVTERPTRLSLDENNALHSETGPAIQWASGYGCYMWHGTDVPGEWIEDPDSVDPSLALNWGNIEERRCLAEIIGWDKVVDQLDSKVVDKNPDPMIGTLIEVDLPDSGKERFLRAFCATGVAVVLPVPSDVETAWQANAWTYGKDPDNYRIIGRV